MPDDPVRPAASTPEALRAVIAGAFSRGGAGAFLAAHEEGAGVVVPPGGTCAHGLDEIRAAAAAARVIYGRTGPGAAGMPVPGDHRGHEPDPGPDPDPGPA
jgi:hypothetical protein